MVNIHIRHDHIDICKGFLIILVIVSHIPNLIFHNAKILEWIHSFFMPAFFLVSGCFFKGVNSWEKLKKKAQRLLIPYFVFMVWGDIAWIARTIVKNDTDISQLYAFLWGGGTTNGPIWFLLSLFEINIITNIIIKIPSKWGQLGIVIGLAGLAYKLQSIDWLSAYNIRTSLICLPFFYWGYAYKNFFIERFPKIGTHVVCIVAISTILLYYFFHSFNGLGQGHVSWPFVPFYIYVTLFTCLILYISKKIEMTFIGNLLENIGKRSLGIMCLHVPLIEFMYFFLWITDNYYLNILTLGVVVLFESIIITDYIMKKSPWMLGR